MIRTKACPTVSRDDRTKSPESPPRTPEVEGISPKIQPCHQDRLAVVYVRQSSPDQVSEHRESRELQYARAARAERFGWCKDLIMLIDEDQGHSGT